MWTCRGGLTHGEWCAGAVVCVSVAASAWQGAWWGWATAQHSASAAACAWATGWLELERAWPQQASPFSGPAPKQLPAV